MTPEFLSIACLVFNSETFNSAVEYIILKMQNIVDEHDRGVRHFCGTVSGIVPFRSASESYSSLLGG